MTMVCSWQAEGRIVKVLAMDEAEAETETDERARDAVEPDCRCRNDMASPLHPALCPFFPCLRFCRERESPS